MAQFIIESGVLLQIVEASNALNESSITLVNDQRVCHGSIAAFREAVIWKTFTGWETPATIRAHLMMPLRPYRVPELRIMVKKLLDITPCQAPNLDNIEACFRVQNAWNAAEYVWQKSDRFGYLSWGTSA